MKLGGTRQELGLRLYLIASFERSHIDGSVLILPELLHDCSE